MKQLNDSCISEITEFNETWDNKLKEHQDKSIAQETALVEKHKIEKQELIQKEKAASSKILIKFSGKYIQLTQTEEKLVKENK